MKFLCHAILLACLLVGAGRIRPAWADWTADIVDSDWSPTRFVAVDKNAQSLALLIRQSPLRVAETIPCATGQELGDKFKEGDLKTPEGVYFITKRKNAGLNYNLYGDLAFVLNFPNPMDVLRRKSGHGIWIHGRGHPIIPYETQGCVALNTQDIHQLDQSVAENMPVIIADNIQLGGDQAKKVEGEGREVVAATQAWAKAWQNKSSAFFEFIDPEKFALTEGQSFAAFRSHKERLFKILPWIQVRLFDVRAVPGPDYWVTYFIQVYRSPSLISQGVKRLYWQRGGDGRFRIVGMEYDEMPVTLADKNGIKPNQALAAEEHEPSTRHPDEASEEETHVRQLVDAQQPLVEKMAQKAFHLLTLHRQPTKEDEAILEVAQSAMAAKTDAAPVVPAPPAKPTPSPAPAPAPTAPPTPVAAQPAPVAKPDALAQVKATVETWRAAWEKGQLDAYVACYAADAHQGNLRGQAAIRSQKASLWAAKPPKQVTLTDLRVMPDKQGFVVEAQQHYAGSDGHRDTGWKRLRLLPAKNGFVIAQEEWTRGPSQPEPTPTTAEAPAPPAAPKAAAPAPTPVQVAGHEPPQVAVAQDTAQAQSLIETWRAAWEQGHLDAFVDCYAPDIVFQGGRRGKTALRAQKAKLWASKPPRRVTFSDIVISPATGGLTANFTQEYEGSDGIRRKGRKTLLLTPTPNGWRISQEKWSRS